jgi:hypothetical protein
MSTRGTFIWSVNTFSEYFSEKNFRKEPPVSWRLLSLDLRCLAQGAEGREDGKC